MYTIPKWPNRVIVSVLLLIVGCIGIGLYAASGLPRPWTRAGPEAIENLNHSNLHVLGKLVRDSTVSIGKPPASWAELQTYAEQRNYGLDGLRYEVPGKEPFEIRTPYEVGRIVVFGTKRDHVGMVWAITEHGHVLKVIPVFPEN